MFLTNYLFFIDLLGLKKSEVNLFWVACLFLLHRALLPSLNVSNTAEQAACYQQQHTDISWIATV